VEEVAPPSGDLGRAGVLTAGGEGSELALLPILLGAEEITDANVVEVRGDVDERVALLLRAIVPLVQPLEDLILEVPEGGEEGGRRKGAGGRNRKLILCIISPTMHFTIRNSHR
jgi:hypothetical protein